MQTIKLEKFGRILVSRPAGLESFNAIRPSINANEPVEIDFDGVLTLTPSWFDEFLSSLARYNHGKVELKPTTNASVLAVLPVMEIARKDEVANIVHRALERMKAE